MVIIKYSSIDNASSVLVSNDMICSNMYTTNYSNSYETIGEQSFIYGGDFIYAQGEENKSYITGMFRILNVCVSITLNFSYDVYLLDKFGSFLFLDSIGYPTWLILRTHKEIRDFATIAKEENDDLSALLQSGNKILFQLTLDDMKTPVSGWSNYLFDAIKFAITSVSPFVRKIRPFSVNCSRNIL